MGGVISVQVDLDGLDGSGLRALISRWFGSWDAASEPWEYALLARVFVLVGLACEGRGMGREAVSCSVLSQRCERALVGFFPEDAEDPPSLLVGPKSLRAMRRAHENLSDEAFEFLCEQAVESGLGLTRRGLVKRARAGVAVVPGEGE